jgi:N-acetyltransferase
MEVNYLFHLILHNLGFDVYMAGSRIFLPTSKTYGGWTHVVNVVTVDSLRYLLDGGMGPNGPTFPMPLHDGKVVTQVSNIRFEFGVSVRSDLMNIFSGRLHRPKCVSFMKIYRRIWTDRRNYGFSITGMTKTRKWRLCIASVI